MVECMFDEQNQRYRSQIAELNESWGLREKKSLKNLMRYFGVVKFPEWANKWTDPDDLGFAYVGNYCYAQVFKRVWPASHITQDTDDTIGDHMEAVLGYYYMMVRVCEADMDEQVTDVISMLDQALFCQWALVHFHQEEL